MSVESFDPSNMAAAPSPQDVQALMAAAFAYQDGEPSLTAAEIERFAPLATRADWVAEVADASDEDALIALVRLITAGEAAFGAWAAGDKSPVIALVRALKARDAYPKSLTAWIKATSDNRFLPHGSLMDRL